ncbi:hypothetical protein F5Y15DRAFT_271104 [Xylariaceae sp. FL0016]|nr:hypothetical protein F5Y15DRAFT_271104 [Xylariaceae sp. FL0016]
MDFCKSLRLCLTYLSSFIGLEGALTPAQLRPASLFCILYLWKALSNLPAPRREASGCDFEQPSHSCLGKLWCQVLDGTYVLISTKSYTTA